jgi:hypothetical protein
MVGFYDGQKQFAISVQAFGLRRFVSCGSGTPTQQPITGRRQCDEAFPLSCQAEAQDIFLWAFQTIATAWRAYGKTATSSCRLILRLDEAQKMTVFLVSVALGSL